MSVVGQCANFRDDAQFRTIKADLKRLSAPLGKARNLDVFLTRTLPDEIKRNPDQVELLNVERIGGRRYMGAAEYGAR